MHVPVKNKAQNAMYLWNSTMESNGKYLLKNVSLKNVQVFLHIVIKIEEYVNIIAEAAPRVMVTP